ncbi:MAG TPA: molybdopterin-dependent oxidoreductase, partial [Azonexus sp.]|nr:molybdopterin-dependent oxidoreductase [Azonexus sp.]
MSTSLIGRPLPHESARLHVSGKAHYVDDLPQAAGTLHAAPGLSTIARGRIRSMDLSAVRAYPGVRAVLTAADIPGDNNCGPILHDDPILADGEIRFHGQPLFVVAAETRDIARQAVRLAKIDYEIEPPILDMDAAIAAESWVLPPFSMQRGAVDAAFADAPHRLSGNAVLGGQEHFYLEGQISYAQPGDDGTLHVLCSTQH